jgi:cytochrome c oxidase cbb3-type subunit II
VNRPARILLGAVGVLLGTSITLVILPYSEFAAIPPEPNLRAYTIDEARGREVYVADGCMYCHSQQPRDRNFAPDEARGWGRPSTPGDYAYDYPHQLGTMRTGPDLFNIGARQPSVEWHLTHLYSPRAVVPGSLMPAHRFLFEEKVVAGPKDTVVKMPDGKGPPGQVVVATPDALALVAYLRALDHTYPSALLPRPPVEPAATKGGTP